MVESKVHVSTTVKFHEVKLLLRTLRYPKSWTFRQRPFTFPTYVLIGAAAGALKPNERAFNEKLEERKGDRCVLIRKGFQSDTKPIRTMMMMIS